MSSRIIRSDGAPELAAAAPADRPAPPRAARPGVVDAEVYDAHQKAREIVESAQRQAAQILRTAESARDELAAKAREDGYQEGLAEATAILVRARQEHRALVSSAEADAVRLALAIAQKIIGRALELDRELLLPLVAQAAESVRHHRELVLRVHPGDAELLRASRRKLMDLMGRTREIAVREDAEESSAGAASWRPRAGPWTPSSRRSSKPWSKRSWSTERQKDRPPSEGQRRPPYPMARACTRWTRIRAVSSRLMLERVNRSS